MEELLAKIIERQERIEQKLDALLAGREVKETMNVREVADYLGVTTGRIRALVSEGSIPHYKNERCTRNYFSKADIDAWRKGRRVRTNAEIRASL